MAPKRNESKPTPSAKKRGETSRKTQATKPRQGSSSKIAILAKSEEPLRLWTPAREEVLYRITGLRLNGHDGISLLMIKERLRNRFNLDVSIEGIRKFIHEYLKSELVFQFDAILRS